ncbi:hypothetical protein CERZMDRAFT_102101 [Cercospora zeae-maydis SCOH1-5]|uniref:Uncharacterized protein n=1 Tax=Cercospora zeae-maydis SCOH1-5 TaxID=717836 RepID=A0A6A6F3E7_9PEZI|nr:hypothetical protein CERZMDRAFT_102101 [Cercospora zeae-maydis SCOH1-5]
MESEKDFPLLHCDSEQLDISDEAALLPSILPTSAPALTMMAGQFHTPQIRGPSERQASVKRLLTIPIPVSKKHTKRSASLFPSNGYQGYAIPPPVAPLQQTQSTDAGPPVTVSSSATPHPRPDTLSGTAASQLPSSTSTKPSLDLSTVITSIQLLPPLPTPGDKQLNYIRPPLHINLTPEEILTFWPGWLTSPELAVRMQRNGITAKMITTVRLTATGKLNDRRANKLLTDNLKKQFSHGGRLYYDCGSHWNVQMAKADGSDNDMTANGWQPREEHILANDFRLDGKTLAKGAWWNGSRLPAPTQEWRDMALTEFFMHIPRAQFPTGQGRGLLTRCLEAVHDDPDYDILGLTTAHWDWLIKHLCDNDPYVRDVQPQDPAKNLDQEFVERFTASH